MLRGMKLKKVRLGEGNKFILLFLDFLELFQVVVRYIQDKLVHPDNLLPSVDSMVRRFGNLYSAID